MTGTLLFMHQPTLALALGRRRNHSARVVSAPMVTRYITHMKRMRRSPNTIRLRLFYLQKFSQWFGRDLATVTHDDLEAYIFANPRWSENTQQSATASLKSFYGWAAREGLVTPNPTRDLPNIIVHRVKHRMASEESIRAAIQCDDPADRAMVMLGAECGLRVAEIARLNREDRDGEWLRIIGKGNALRTPYMSPELCNLLDSIETTTMRHGNYFPGQSGRQPIHPSTAWRHITAVLHSNPHSLRRRAGTVVYRASGFDIRLAQEFLGHRQITTTEDYLEVTNRELINAASLTRLAA